MAYFYPEQAQKRAIALHTTILKERGKTIFKIFEIDGIKNV